MDYATLVEPGLDPPHATHDLLISRRHILDVLDRSPMAEVLNHSDWQFDVMILVAFIFPDQLTLETR